MTHAAGVFWFYCLSMDLDLTGRTALVTGSSRGIGLAISRALLAEGARVFGVARGSSPEVEKLAEMPAFDYLGADLTTDRGLDDLDAFVSGDLDVLVNNVGSAPPRPGGFASITTEDWVATFTLNLLTAVRVTRRLEHRLVAGSSIVNIASENSILADPMVMDYSAAKAGMLSFTKSLSKEFAARGVRVNCVSPGPVETDLWLGKQGVAEKIGAATGAAPDAVRKGAEAGIPTGRFSRPDEVADVVTVLASPRFGNVTGAEFVIDGGMRPTI